MGIGKETRASVRQRANFACEYCGVSETDTGSELTIDHYQPITKGGEDIFENLVYCCHRCNVFKSDYFPASLAQPLIWNPRLSSASQHFIHLEDGQVKGLTQIGEFTIQILKLNRSQLIALRLRKQKESEIQQLLSQLLEISSVMKQTNEQVNNLSQQQQTLLDEQLLILRILTNKA
jgi:hypothetical protein